VLVAAAVILIPEMLSGSNPQHAAEPASANGEAPLKTYTIDLSKSPAAQAAATASGAIDDRAPPAETSPTAADPALAPQAGPESGDAEVAAAQPADSASATQAVPSVEAQPSGASSRVAESGASPQTKPASSSPRVAQTAPTKPSTAAPRTAESATASQPKPVTVPRTSETAPARNVPPLADGHWAVQLGSFSSRATAEKMVKDLRADGQSAFVMPVKSGAATLYRVRVGPMQDRQSAQQALARLKAKVPAAAIVPHP